jgi:hypothetical protein
MIGGLPHPASPGSAADDRATGVVQGACDDRGIAQVAADHRTVAQHDQLVGNVLRVLDVDLLEQLLKVLRNQRR